MSSDNIALRVSHLSKQYRLGGPQEPYHTFRDAVVNSVRAPLKYFRKASLEEGFWALNDVSFEVEQGEVVGVIGRNGAGKSTLLKILSRITSPTEGIVELHGRVGSLLEVGTGFHPELTGRENIYLSGSILGMKHREIDVKLDDIVKFSEIERFLDTPVKRYSSGMYVRLAFAVAAHLEPEILLVDEVLAVGDAEFQKKCLGKMGDVAREGRTVIFVSHQMAAVENLCSRTILLESGHIKADGKSSEVIEKYLKKSYGDSSFIDLAERKDRRGSGEYRFQKVWLSDSAGNTVNFFRTGDKKISVNTILQSTTKSETTLQGVITLVINDFTGVRLTAFISQEKDLILSLERTSIVTFDIECIHLLPGRYPCNLFFGRWGGNDAYDFVENAFTLEIEPGDFFGIGKLLLPQPDKFVVDFNITCRSLGKADK